MLNYQVAPLNNTRIEYKIGHMPYPHTLAKDIAALANSEGGVIIFHAKKVLDGEIKIIGGISTDGTLLLLNHETIQNRIEAALRYLDPQPSINQALIMRNLSVPSTNEILCYLPLDKLESEPPYDPELYKLLTYEIRVHRSQTPILTSGRYYVRKENQTTQADEKLIEALGQTVPAFNSTVLNSLGKEKIDTKAVRKTRDVTEIVREQIEEKTNIDLSELLSESIKHTRTELTKQHKERQQQARIAFMVATIFLTLAIMLVFIGVILIFTINLQVGVVTAVSSIVSGIVSGLALTFNKQTNERADEYVKEMIVLEKSHTAMQCISYITDVKVRDEAISSLAKSIQP